MFCLWGNVQCTWQRQAHTEELLAMHEKDCMWADLLRETQCFIEPLGKHSTTPLRPSTPIPSTTQESQTYATENEAHNSSPDHNSSSTSSPRRSYASVLKIPSRTQSPAELKSTSTSRSRSPSPLETSREKKEPHSTPPTPTPTLTVEELRNRFHNKPSPFKLAAHQMPTNCDHFTAVATEALSNFLLSAIPAFRDFYLTFTMGSCRHPSQDQRFCSRGPTGPPGRNLRQRPTTGP